MQNKIETPCKNGQYRIFNKLTGTIQVVAIIDFGNEYVDTYGDTEPMYGIKFKDCILNQYTGLNDANKFPIYKDDILQLTEEGLKYFDPGRKNLLVGLSGGAFMLGISNNPYDFNKYLWVYGVYCTVVGNLHLNKELLNT